VNGDIGFVACRAESTEERISMNEQDEARARIWTDLYHKVVDLLRQFGNESPFTGGDFFVVDDDYGWRRIIVNIFNLEMLNPQIVVAIRDLLANLPDWEVVYALDVPGKETAWPDMGLTIRRHEIIDGLRREFLPEPYRTIVIPGSRPGTGDD
jgi:hypothetical protein